MKTLSLTLVNILLISTLQAYQDKDLDGIEDKYDICPNTPFDAKVDRFGCSITPAKKNMTNNKHLTLSIGTTLREDSRYESDSSLSFYANYQFSNWNISVSNTRSVTSTDYNENETDSDNDIYLSLGYTTYMPSTLVKLSIGTKLTSDTNEETQNNRFSKFTKTDDATTGNRDNDYFAAINLDHFLSKKQDIFLYYSYTNSGDSPNYDYEDYSSFSIGSGYQFTPAFYSALSYNYTGSIYQNADAQETISWYNSYSFHKNFFITGTYSYALDDYSYQNTYIVSLGARF